MLEKFFAAQKIKDFRLGIRFTLVGSFAHQMQILKFYQ